MSRETRLVPTPKVEASKLPPNRGTETPMSTVEEQEERLRLAMVESNVSELDALLSPELVFTTFLGQTISKEDDLEAHRSGFLNIHSITLSETKVQRVETSYVVTCLAEIDASFDEDRTKRGFRFLRVWSPNAAGDLQVIAGQATLVFEGL